MGKLITIAASLLNLVLAVTLYSDRADFHSKTILPELAPGSKVPSLIGADVMGRPVSVDFPNDRPTVLYVFSPSCGFCKKNERSAERLASALSGHIRFVAVSLDRDGLFEWLNLVRPQFSVITDLSFRTYQAYRFESTPTTIAVSSSGVVEGVWKGAYVGDNKNRIEAKFGVYLPQGLDE
jgi:thiol-disulfide isomerase/thioredoxin